MRARPQDWGGLGKNCVLFRAIARRRTPQAPPCGLHHPRGRACGDAATDCTSRTSSACRESPCLTINEGDTAGGSYSFVLTGEPTGTVTVTVGGTAGTDVTAEPSTLTFTTSD